MKRIHFRIWPEIVGYIPAIIPLPAIEKKNNNIYINFNNCVAFSSTGANILLIKLLRIIKSDMTTRTWSSDFNTNPEMLRYINHLGIRSHLEKISNNQSLFTLQESLTSNVDPITVGNMTSFPIYEISFNNYPNNRRAAIDDFKDWLLTILKFLNKKYCFRYTQLIAIIIEMAKNSADHTTDNAYFGIDFLENNDCYEVEFSFGDLGEGIKNNIQMHLPNKLKIHRDKHWSLYESYYVALQPGYTSKPKSGINKGIGMSLIVDGSKGINLDLSIFDASSRGKLSNISEVSHAELRKNFYNIGKDVGFAYYGKIKIF